MSVLVTGADGFVGRHLVRTLLAGGRDVVAAIGPGGRPAEDWTGPDLDGQVRTRLLDLSDPASIGAAADDASEAVIHLAALSSGSAAQRDPGRAWQINAGGTAQLCGALSRRPAPFRGTVLVVSSAEVYGIAEPRLRSETDPVAPCSPYAATKAASEIAALETWRRTGLRVVVVRPFPHTGPGQSPQFVVPALLERLRAAREAKASTVQAGNLSPVRDFLDVRDVVRAYLALLTDGEPGEAYNVARGAGLSLREIFDQLCQLLGVEAKPIVDPALLRQADIPHLVGDASKLRTRCGWTPTVSLAQTLRDMVHAQAN
ncbi:MAG TPA: GDP-mannose 4,6-dehydratase [Gemmatimonadales bacterium]|nr:GDP-mannose 4,6-dehydratase [Gemmatimonadales bacterium]